MGTNSRTPFTFVVIGAVALLTTTAAAQTPPPLRVRYLIPFAAPTDNDMRPHFDIINSGTTTVALSELTLRYWFTVDGMWTLFRDSIGVSAAETRDDYNRFGDAIFVPSTFSGRMPNGDPINSSSTFLSIRSKYRTDPAFPQVQAFLTGGPAPVFHYHRFWAQADVALANAEYGRLFPN